MNVPPVVDEDEAQLGRLFDAIRNERYFRRMYDDTTVKLEVVEEDAERAYERFDAARQEVSKLLTELRRG